MSASDGVPRQSGGAQHPAVNIRQRLNEDRGALAGAADRLTAVLIHPTFFVVLLLFNLLWMLLNLQSVIGVKPWDPYPYMFLATLTSAAGPLISTLILIGLHRSRRSNELRQELTLQLALHTERQATYTLRFLDAIGKKLGVANPPSDPKLDQLSQDLDVEQMLGELRRSLEETEGPES